MDKSVKCCAAIIFVFCYLAPCYAQTTRAKLGVPAVTQPEASVRRSGQARITYDEKQNLTKAYVYSDIYDRIVKYSIVESLSMTVSFEVIGDKIAEPEFIQLKLSTFSAVNYKHKSNYKITIYVDDELLLTGEPETLFSNKFKNQWREYFTLSKIEYKTFRKMVAAKKIVVQLGQTKIEIQPEFIEALKDLDKSTKL